MDNNVNTNKLYWLPQVSAPFNYVVANLKNENIPYSRYEINSTDLKPLQDKINPDSVDHFKKIILNKKKLKPIFISNDNEILDGHHRYVANKALYGDEGKVMCYKINTDTQTAARALNKIQDRYEFENTQESKFEPISKYLKKPEINWYESLKNVTYIVYRKETVKENSESGNFFMFKKKENMIKYKVEFDNLMYIPIHLMDNTNELPTVWLGKKLLPEKNYEEMARLHNISIQNLINKDIANKIKELGFDGINYGDRILQTL
jgi:hypothetical protein